MSHLSRHHLKKLGMALFAGALIAAPLPVHSADFEVTTVVEGLNGPWSLAFLPDGDMLVTELSGDLRRVSNGVVSDPIAGVPDVYYRSQGGLFDVVLHPRFEENQTVYLAYSTGTRKANATRLAKAQLTDAGLENLEVIFEVDFKKDTSAHFGGRIAFLADGTLLLTTGDGFNYREEAQNLSNHMGSTIRLNDDGSVPSDNPYVDQAGAKPEIWTHGHRNPQGLAVDPIDETVYLTEHGPRGGDEVNVLAAGKNYGWPVITYGRDYSGARISPFTERPGLEQPLVDWTPSIAPSGLTVYRGGAFPDWNGDLFAGALKEGSLHRIDLEDGAVAGEEVLLEDMGYRIRDVRSGPDGFLYVVGESKTSSRYKENSGKIFRLEPASD